MLLPLLFCGRLSAQPAAGYDVFIPICKYIVQGNADRIRLFLLIALSLMASHVALAQRFAVGTNALDWLSLGTLNAGGENYSVTIFVSSKGKSYKIQQLKIEQQQL